MDWSYFKYYVGGNILYVLVMFVAGFMFSEKHDRRNNFWLRYILSCILVVGLSVGLAALSYYIEFSIDNTFIKQLTALVIYLIIFAGIIGSMLLSYKAPLIACLTTGVLGYLCQHGGYQIYSVLNLATNLEIEIYNKTGDLGIFLVLLVQTVCYAAILVLEYFVMARRLAKYKATELDRSNALFIVILSLTIVLILNMICNTVAMDDVAINIVMRLFMLVCIGCVFALFAKMFEMRSLQLDLDMLEKLNKEEHIHYLRLKENMDLINIKCHDIKHYISLAGSGGIDLDELSKQVNIYDSTIKTGNDIIDTLLAERNLYCSAHDITLTVMADAAGLAFISVADMCALFGNILENAVEAVEGVEDGDKRIININIHTIAGQISVCVENYFTGKPEIEDGLPVSVKDNSRYHGFGLKSIKMIVEKYEGVFSYQIKDDLFRISILFPLKH